MSNTLAFILAVMVLSAIGADYVLFDGEYTLYMLRKIDEFIEWIAFWR